MTSILSVARRFRAGAAAPRLIAPLLVFCPAAALAQQTASPDLLPPVEVTAPKPKPRPAQAAPRVRRAPIAARMPAPAAAAQSTPAPVVAASGAPNRGPVVVSPTAVVTPASQVASSVTVVTDKDIASQQYRSVPDALNTVPGVNVVQSGPGSQASVFMRGTNSNHTKVLIDGIDVGDPSTPNGAFDYAHLLAADIQQLEILRGPQSGLYGSDAIGGVISVITRKGDGPPRATASTETGSFNTFNQSVGLSGSQDNFNYAFNVVHLHAGDVPVTPLQLLPPGQKAIGNNYDNMTYSTKLGYALNEDWTVNSVVRYTDATLLFTGDNNDFPSAPNPTQSSHNVHELATREEAVWSLLDGRVVNTFGVNYVTNRSADLAPGDLASTVGTGDRIKYDWRAVTRLAPGNDVIVGLEQQTDRFDTTDFSASNGNKAGYVELQSSFAKRFFLTANLRNDVNDAFGSHATYRVAPAVIIPFTETKLKASYGTGFKAPSLSELYQNFPDFDFFANPDLKPEDSAGYDAGFEQPLFNNRVSFGSTYFHNTITNLIVSSPIAGSSAFTYANVGLATTEGTETFVAAQVTDRLALRADYTFTRAVDASTGLQLLRRPKEKWSATATYTAVDPLTLSATLLHVSDWVDISRDGTVSGLIAPGYTIVNLRGDYAVRDQVKLFARVDNLFNTHYQNPTGFLAPGLGVFGGIRVASYGVN